MIQAVELIITLDPELLAITLRTLEISISSTLIAVLISVPLGGLIYFKTFRGKRSVINLIQTLYSLPTVLVGLLVFLLISNEGPLGSLQLLFTPAGMILGQTLLILPIIIGFTITALSSVKGEIKDLALSLGASEFQTSFIYYEGGQVRTLCRRHTGIWKGYLRSWSGSDDRW